VESTLVSLSTFVAGEDGSELDEDTTLCIHLTLKSLGDFSVVCTDEGPEDATAELLLNDRQHLVGQLFEDFLIGPQHRLLRHRLSPSLTANFIRGSSPVGTD
jgi:hypothetical protein